MWWPQGGTLQRVDLREPSYRRERCYFRKIGLWRDKQTNDWSMDINEMRLMYLSLSVVTPSWKNSAQQLTCRSSSAVAGTSSNSFQHEYKPDLMHHQRKDCGKTRGLTSSINCCSAKIRSYGQPRTVALIRTWSSSVKGKSRRRAAPGLLTHTSNVRITKNMQNNILCTFMSCLEAYPGGLSGRTQREPAREP